jgi:hypothetical protein
MTEAEAVFAAEVARWRATSWDELRGHLDDAVAYEVPGETGVGYQFEVLVLWDDPREATTLRVLITGDDGDGWKFSSRRMRNDSFLVAPDGTFVGE